MKLNCDLGESYGAWQMGADEQIMPLIDMANIACGMHAGDPLVMQKTLLLAKSYQVEVGAHPSYPDRQGFGRRSMCLADNELIATLHYQLSTLQGMAALQQLQLSYVKPHGALYNDMMQDAHLRQVVFEAVASFDARLAVMVLAGPWQLECRQQADACGVQLLFEAFADRRYADNGTLMPRQHPAAVLNHADALRQTEQLLAQGTVTSVSGAVLPLQADTICVHGDNPQALALVQDIRHLCN